MSYTVIIPGSILKNNELRKQVLQNTENKTAIDDMKDLLQDRYDVIFNADGTSKGYAICFYNNELVDSLHGKHFQDGDELEIIIAKSGG